jgi:membrane-associated phospholipid phosphatase
MSTAGRVGVRAGGETAKMMHPLRRFWANIVAGAAAVFRAPRPGARRPAWPPRSRLVLGAVLAIAAIAAAMILLDARSLAGVPLLPVWFIELFNDLTELGLAGWFLYPTGILLLVIAAVDSPALPAMTRGVMAALAARLGFVFSAIAVPGLFVTVVKRLIGRARPLVGGNDTWAYTPFGWQVEYASFPSGHATNAFSAAFAIGAIWPKTRPFMWTYAAVIALSRVVVTAHHPSDVIAGAIVGTIGALLVRNWFAMRRLGFVVGSDGGVKPLSGPSWRRIKAVARRLVSA